MFSGNTTANVSGERLEVQLARHIAAVLRDRLPTQWEATASAHRVVGDRLRPDGELIISLPDGRTVRTVIEVKRRLEPKEVFAALRQARNCAAALAAETGQATGAVGILVASEYLSPRTRELLVSEGAGYADLAGNLRIAVNDPPIFIELTGRDSNPRPDSRSLQSLKGAAAGRAVRALCDFRPPYGVKELAERSNTPIATISRVVNLLDTEALLIREPRGPVTDVRWPDLIRRWTQDYSFTDSNYVSSYLEPRGLPVLLNKLPTLSARYALTGSLAATDLAPIAAPRLATIFVDSPLEDVAPQLGLRPAETGANVLLVRPYDDVVFERPRSRDRLLCASPSQVAADLLTGPGRAPAEGEALLEWMRDHEDDWRS